MNTHFSELKTLLGAALFYTNLTSASFKSLEMSSACLFATSFVHNLNNVRMIHGKMKMIPCTMLKSMEYTADMTYYLVIVILVPF